MKRNIVIQIGVTGKGTEYTLEGVRKGSKGSTYNVKKIVEVRNLFIKLQEEIIYNRVIT